MFMNCDAIITSYNESSERLNRTINGCLCQTVPFRRIIVVDDGSTELPSSRDGLINCEKVELIVLAKNQGISAARNAALARSDADLVACLNVDVVLDERWVEVLSEFLFANEAVGAVFGKLVPSEIGLIAQWRMRFHEINFDRPSGKSAFAPGHAVLFRKRFVDEIGGYNVRLRLVAEDSDISERLIEKGHDIYYINNVGVVSIQENSISLLAKKHIVRLSYGQVDNMTSIGFFMAATKDFLHRIGRNFWKRRFLFIHIDFGVYLGGFYFYYKRMSKLNKVAQDCVGFFRN